MPSTSKATPKRQHVCIIGAGPAGLTAAYELQQHSDCTITLFEKTTAIGGISQTVNTKEIALILVAIDFFLNQNGLCDGGLTSCLFEARKKISQLPIRTISQQSMLLNI